MQLIKEELANCGSREVVHEGSTAHVVVGHVALHHLPLHH